MEEPKHRRRDGDPHRPRGSRSHREGREAGLADPAAGAATAAVATQPRGERRHRNAVPPGDEREREREHRRPGHSSHSHSSHSHGHRSERDAERESEHGGHRGDRSERRERGEHSERGEARPVQIVQRSGGSGGGQVKILGQSSSHRSRPPPESSHTGLGAVPEDSRHPDGQPVAPKKKQSFSMPVAAAAFSRCRLMDEEWRVCVDAVHPHLLESGSEFTVVACIGAQGAGKSTVLSLLLSSFQGLLGKTPGGDKAETPSANAGNSGPSPFEALAGDSSPEPDAGFEAPLDIHSQRSFLEGEASPAGVDLCVSSMDRLLLLDAQPLFACEALPEAELKSELYLLTFLVSICHTLLVVTDAPVDLQLWKLLRLLAMLKSKVPDLPTWVERQSEGGERQEQQFPLRESLPRLVIAFNNVKQGCDIPELYQPVQAFLEHTLWKGAPSTQCVQIPTLPGSSLSALLTSNVAYRAGMQLREKVLANGPERGRFGKDRLQLTEREWLYHVSGYWDFVQKVPIVQDYFSMLGQGLESYGWPKC